VVLEIVRDQNVEQLKLAAGEIDFTQSEVRPADYAALNRAKAQGRVEIADLGVGRDGDLLWFNLSRSKRRDLRSAWLQHADFRRAVSAAIDRDRFVNTVYFGAAVPAHGIVSPANRLWYAADAAAPPFDRAAVQRLLASLRLRDVGARLVDHTGAPVRFSLLTQKGNTSLERGAAFIRDSLADVGVQVDVVELEVGALVSRFSRGDYDAVYFRLLTTDTDPSLNPDFWRSSGDAHIWAPSQSSPATPWEGDIDRLIAQITAAPDADERHRLFAEVQRIVAREVPVLCFAFPRVWVATSVRVTGARPALVRPPILWDPAIVSVG